jgi:hypothetical protein
MGSSPTFTEIANVTSISGPSISRNVYDVTAHDSTDSYMEFIGGLKDGGELSFDLNWDPGDQTHVLRPGRPGPPRLQADPPGGHRRVRVRSDPHRLRSGFACRRQADCCGHLQDHGRTDPDRSRLVTLKDKILAADDLPREPLIVPEWGINGEDDGWIRGLTGTERDAYESSVRQFKGQQMVVKLENVRARLVSLCLVDGEGNRVFSDKEVMALGAKSGKVLDRLFDQCAALSGLTADQVEELAEVFDVAQSDEAGSD